jgi:hypothetical protein
MAQRGGAVVACVVCSAAAPVFVLLGALPIIELAVAPQRPASIRPAYPRGGLVDVMPRVVRELGPRAPAMVEGAEENDDRDRLGPAPASDRDDDDDARLPRGEVVVEYRTGRMEVIEGGQGRECEFEDSDGKCWARGEHGVCAGPRAASGTRHGSRVAALVQHANATRLCAKEPPFGFSPLCRSNEATAALRTLRSLRDPAACHYRTCAVVGASGNLLGARLGKEIDAHDAVLRINLAPDGNVASEARTAPHTHRPTWIADVGGRTTWRVLTMELFAYMNHYPRTWLAPPGGHGTHENMSDAPQAPLLALACHTPSRIQLDGREYYAGMGRCSMRRIRQIFDQPWSASYLLNPVMIDELQGQYLQGAENHLVPSTGLIAIAFARRLCGEVHMYGFGNGSCGDACYHYYDCGSTADKKAGRSQRHYFGSTSASRGFHNLSAQASVLRRMAAEGVLKAHWGGCAHSLGNPPRGTLRRQPRGAAR